MGKTNLEKNLKKKWACPEGCDVSTKPCKHIEELLPSMGAGQYYNNDRGKRARIIYTQDLDWFVSKAQPDTQMAEIEEQMFYELMDDAQLTEMEREVLIARVMHNLTFKRIAELQKFAGGARTVSTVYKTVLTKMRRFYETKTSSSRHRD